jgi:hypothetical protein
MYKVWEPLCEYNMCIIQETIVYLTKYAYIQVQHMKAQQP